MKAVSPAVDFEFGFRDRFDTFLNIMKTNLLFIFLFPEFIPDFLVFEQFPVRFQFRRP